MSDQINQSLLKDNFYQAVNGNWLKHAKIPADHSATGGFNDLVDQIDKTLIHDSDKLLSGKMKPKTPEMKEYKKFYAMTTNFQKRDDDGNKPLLPILHQVESLSSLKDLNAHLADWELSGMPLPYGYDIDADMKNAQVNALFAYGPGLFLPDKTYYKKGNHAAKKLMPIFTKMSQQLLILAGYSASDAHDIVENAKKFDRMIAPHVMSSEEAADIRNIYNPDSFAHFAKSSSYLDLTGQIKALIGTVPKKLIVAEPNYFKVMDKIVNPKNFGMMKDWMLVNIVIDCSGCLSEEFRQTGSVYGRALSGQKKAVSQKKAAYYLADGTFSQVVGNYYGHKYFGPKAKADVLKMVHKMIDVYKKRLANNTWLTKPTRQHAIEKLDRLIPQVGYPDHLDPLYKKFKVTTTAEGGTILSNLIKFTQIATQDMYDHWNKPVRRTRWEMSADEVNAYYHPFKNIIVFPAAILQAPFYSLKQSASANYGGIGAVMAHEISHAFDNNGSQFDKYGNMNNWWTQTDKANFKQRAQKMIKEFNGIPFAGQKVNGKLTVSENIADAGGLSCALEAAKSTAHPDLAAFFINWARIWRTKSTSAHKKLLLSIDVHAPSELRAQVQVKNLDDFYKTFNVKPGDGMYLPPKDRVKIW
ncbi:MAG: M13 family peptidase [Acetilactobacillus jinshanensis]